MQIARKIFISIGIALALSMMSIGALGLPQFRLGYWNAEPITFGMYAASAAIALWLCIGIALGWLRLQIARGNTLVILWGCWLLWQIIATIGSQNMLRSWYGPPEQAEGLGWYLCMSVFMLQLSTLWHSQRFRTILLSYSFAFVFTIAALHFVSDELNNMFAGFVFDKISPTAFINWLPFVWPDYLGFIAAWWWIALMLAFPRISLKYLLPIFALMFAITIASSNHGAIALINYAMLISIAARIMPLLRLPYFGGVTLAWRRMAMAALIAPLLWLFASPFIKVDYSEHVSQSIPTRVLLNEVTLHAIADKPSRLLFGRGWGRFEDDFFQYGLVRDVRVYDNGRHAPNWPMIRGYNYHSHNMASETLLSLGLIGFLLWMLMPIAAVRLLPAVYFWPAVPMLIAAVVLNHVWFAVPQVMPFQALGWFLLMLNMPASRPSPAAHRSVAFAALAMALLFGWSAAAQYNAMRYSQSLADPFGERYGTPLTEAKMEEDIMRGGDRLRVNFINYTKRLVTNTSRVQEKHIALYNDYLTAMETMSGTATTGAYNASVVLYGYNTIMSTLRGPLFVPLQQRATQNYLGLAEIHTRNAPYREDYITPYMAALANLSYDPEHARLMDAVGKLLAINHAHRSALWLGGRVLSTRKEFEAQGREMMRSALTLGADRVYTITNKEILALH